MDIKHIYIHRRTHTHNHQYVCGNDTEKGINVERHISSDESTQATNIHTVTVVLFMAASCYGLNLR